MGGGGGRLILNKASIELSDRAGRVPDGVIIMASSKGLFAVTFPSEIVVTNEGIAKGGVSNEPLVRKMFGTALNEEIPKGGVSKDLVGRDTGKRTGSPVASEGRGSMEGIRTGKLFEAMDSLSEVLVEPVRGTG